MRIVKNIRRSNRELAIFSMGLQTTTNLKGCLTIYVTVWFHPGGIANILYLSKAVEKYCVAYNSTGEKKLSYTYPEKKSVHSKNATGDYSTQTWLQGRGRCF